MPDALGRAIRDHHRDDRTRPLRQGDGEETREHPIESFYFDAFDPESDAGSWLASRLEGPLVDLGAGVGRHALSARWATFSGHGRSRLRPSVSMPVKKIASR